MVCSLSKKFDLAIVRCGLVIKFVRWLLNGSAVRCSKVEMNQWRSEDLAKEGMSGGWRGLLSLPTRDDPIHLNKVVQPPELADRHQAGRCTLQLCVQAI